MPVVRRSKKTDAPEPPDLSHIVEQLRSLAVPIGDLASDPANARLHGPKNLDGIKGSLRVYGQRKPVVVNRRTGAVEAGNGTLESARALGWTYIAAVFVDDDAATAAGFGIADKRTAELAEWDNDALDKLLREVNTGNDEQLDVMLAELAAERKLVPPDEANGEPAPDQSGEIPEKYQILIDCESESRQAELLERFTAEGLACRSLIS